MKLLIALCLLVASANALNCDNPTGFTAILCQVRDVAKTVGNSLLDGLKQVSVDAVTKIGGSLIAGLQNLAQSTAATEAPGKRDLDMASIMKVVEFVEGHRDLVDDLGHMVQNITHVTLDKIDGLVKDFMHEPSEELLTKIFAYLQAHHLIQNNIMKFLQENGAGLVSTGLQDLLKLTKTTKRSGDLLSQVTDVGSKLAGSFGPIVDTLKGLVSGLGSQLLGFFKDLLPNADQLAEAFKPHLSALQEHGQNLLDTAKGAFEAVKDAVGDILQETMKQSAPSLNGILSHVGAAVQSMGTTTTATPTAAP